MSRSTAFVIAGISVLMVFGPARAAGAEHSRPPAGRERRGGGHDDPVPPQAWGVAAVVLGAPTERSIRMTVTPVEELEACIAYADPAGSSRTTTPGRLAAGAPAGVLLTNLSPNTAYAYAVRYRKPGAAAFQQGPAYHFQTRRAPGTPFVFEVQGDSHPERAPRQNAPELYARMLLAAAQDRPDFYICLGDDFSVDTLAEITEASVAGVYRRQLPYLGLVAHSSALFLVNGNHEQAALCNLDGTPGSVAVLAQNARNSFYPMPAPDGFYTGNAGTVPHIGLLRNYYAWTWGDALFVVIDFYWHSPGAVDNVLHGGPKRGAKGKAQDGAKGGGKGGDLWQVTLGDEQYRWFRRTLETSRATYKFVFAHHVLGTGRGGVELAGGYEWGGRGRDGRWEFDARRPGWGLPIHAVMATNGVTIFFQGHDHTFARQELDGVVYQTLPDPANGVQEASAWASAFRSGVVRPNSGRLRVAVAPANVRVEYVRTGGAPDAAATNQEGAVDFAYELPALRPGGAK